MNAFRTNFSVRPASMFSVALASAAIAFAAVPAAADVKSGVDAWSAGDFNRAVTEWQMPAEQGDADALFNLAQAYRLGRGVQTDIDRASELYAEAASKGHVKAADNYGLLLFQQGRQRIAMPLIKAAAERGDPRAQYVLGLSHFNADYAPKDWVRAYALMTLAQSSGLPQAQGALVQMDEFIPLEQRQQSQVVARMIESDANKLRAAELAAIDLGQRAGMPQEVAPAIAAPAPRAIRPAKATSTPAQAAPPAASFGKWKVQLGAFGVRGNADRLWSKLSSKGALSGTTKELVTAGKFTRLLATGFNTRADAQAACDELERQGQDCLVAKP